MIATIRETLGVPIEDSQRRMSIELRPHTFVLRGKDGCELARERPQRFFMKSDPDGSSISIRSHKHMDRLAGVPARTDSKLFRKDGDRWVGPHDLSGARHKLLGGLDRLQRREQEPVEIVSWISGGRIVDEHAYHMLAALRGWLKLVCQSCDHRDSPVRREHS